MKSTLFSYKCNLKLVEKFDIRYIGTELLFGMEFQKFWRKQFSKTVFKLSNDIKYNPSH